MQHRSVITGTGSYIPEIVVSNKEFAKNKFFADDQQPLETAPDEIVEKFRQITGIAERRYGPTHLNTSDLATLAAQAAIEDCGLDPETLDQIIVAHNFGNVVINTVQSDAVPSIANRVKHNLKIRNPECVAYDILFGCPGWIQAMIQADAFFKAGMANKILVIGAEMLSRVIDKHDRDSMIFSDGAGAVILERKEIPSGGILASLAVSHSNEETYYINMGPSYHPEENDPTRYIKMKGRKVYEYAITHVAAAMKACLEKAGVPIDQLKKIFIHQANEKMDEAIIRKFYKLYNTPVIPAAIMPMCIQWLGNSSVATVPTLYDLTLKGKLEGHSITRGDIVLFASVGAGMNINAICYQL
ncbi:MAG: ketoacyl-ACP synthase III [Flavisolibacter sp.]|jgi:3-oxoacyl-[acyl-carrier-protein] synthase-3|nr:ketoacyl-ACP synthase III [Flavisolibacter sp.]